MSLESEKKRLSFLMTALSGLELEFRSCRTLLDFLNDAYPEENLIAKLQDMRNSFRVDVREKYDAPLKRFLSQPDEASLDRAVQEWIESLRKPNPTN